MTTMTRSRALTRADLIGYFKSGFKSPEECRIGVEWEKVGVYRDTGQAIAYSGPRGVEAIFYRLSRGYGWRPELANGRIIALRKGESSITLEPGGQIELSGRQAPFLDENAAELHEHLDQLRAVSEPMNIAWLGIGMQPVSSLDAIEWVPKPRYKIMRELLGSKGTMTQSMMKQTAAIQVSLDFTDERDAIEKFQLAMALAPLLSIVFANSPLTHGRLNGFFSKRSDIWAHTAPERTGVPDEFFKPGFSLSDYTDYALSVPLLFLVRRGQWIPVGKLDFAEFMRRGFQGHSARLDDWQLHLSTIFTEARLKTYLEIRSIDCQKKEFGLSVPALIKGLFYDSVSRKKAWAMMKDSSASERQQLRRLGPARGLMTPFKDRTVLEAAIKLVGWSRQGLRRLAGEGVLERSQAIHFLKPLESMLSRGEVPADKLIGCFSGRLSKEEKIKRLMTCAAI